MFFCSNPYFRLKIALMLTLFNCWQFDLFAVFIGLLYVFTSNKKPAIDFEVEKSLNCCTVLANSEKNG